VQVSPSESNKDIIVYTAIFSHYDVLLPPKFEEDNVEYICFTDDSSIVPEPWQARQIKEPVELEIPLDRKLKILPHRYFPEYDYSVWIDGNIQIIASVTEYIRKMEDNTSMITPSHPQRDCIYDEAEMCVQEGRSNEKETIAQMNKYRELGFPPDFGLSWNCVLLREHNNEDIIRTMEVWWEEFQQGTNRDQLSFEFAAWKTGLEYRRVDLNIGSSGGVFLRHNHRPHGIIGDFWEVLIRTGAKRSDIVSDIYYLLASCLYYLHRTQKIYLDKGIYQLLREIRSFLQRKLQ
jgi:hypothetical protein